MGVQGELEATPSIYVPFSSLRAIRYGHYVCVKASIRPGDVGVFSGRTYSISAWRVESGRPGLGEYLCLPYKCPFAVNEIPPM